MEIVHATLLDDAQRQELACSLVMTFGHEYPGWSEEQAFEEISSASPLPITFAAIREQNVLGCISLLVDDEVENYAHVSPWIANLWVKPSERGSGVGFALMHHAMQVAKGRGLTELHLVTNTAASWHQRFGWTPIETAMVHGHEMTVMRCDL